MFRKISLIVLKVIAALVSIYAVFMILFTTVFDLLSLSVYTDFITFLFERLIPNICAVTALLILIVNKLKFPTLK